MRPVVVLLLALPSLGVSTRAETPADQTARRPGAAAAPSAVAAAVGTYRAVRVNRGPLPAVERLRATEGYHHYVKLEQAVVTLRADGRFVASFRYWHHHLKNGTRVPDAPVMSETYRGTYTVRNGTVTFAPQVGRDRKPSRPITGTIAGGMLRVNYSFQDGSSVRPVRLEMERDASW